MAVPDFQTLVLPLLKPASDGQQHTLAEAVERLAQESQLSDDDRAQLLGSGQTRLRRKLATPRRPSEAKRDVIGPRMCQAVSISPGVG
jgi:restriction endonuclease Mrr